MSNLWRSDKRKELGVINDGTLIRKYMGEFMEGKDYFNRLVCRGSFWPRFPVSGDNNVLFLVQKRHVSHGKFYNVLSNRKGEVRELFLHLLFLMCLQPKIICIPK